ncbi:hypothetical protein DCAR_0832446 [Daucus carota subsp. sativus]|uniref:PB1 domain-containing protein n=1 Tax=Daucus carota subsp. sativus TaxID=79200 RepID=A0AAF1BDF3_DAUCS|nr:hypothetical protein DCAR_0832446 [Daucus carota subsp. sativus]
MEENKIEDHVKNHGTKVKFMVSYGGKIQQKLQNHQLSYVGGDTKILSVDYSIKFLDIFQLKYQLPGEDLDALVTLINDEDVENMMFEYYRAQLNSTKPMKLRLFLFPYNRCEASNNG